MEKEYSFIDFVHDDITWCASKCDNTECFRHISHLRNKGGVHSIADFKGTEECPVESSEKSS